MAEADLKLSNAVSMNSEALIVPDLREPASRSRSSQFLLYLSPSWKPGEPLGFQVKNLNKK